MRFLKIQNRKIHMCWMANWSRDHRRKNTMNKTKGNNVPWRKGQRMGRTGRNCRSQRCCWQKSKKKAKKLCPFTQTGLASTMDCVCSCLCVCVYIMFVIWQGCSANQPVGKLALNMWQSGCWAMARLRERKREKRKTLGAWWARKRGKRRRQKWIKLNAMGLMLFTLRLVSLYDWPSRAIYAPNLCGIWIPWSDGSNRDGKFATAISATPSECIDSDLPLKKQSQEDSIETADDTGLHPVCLTRVKMLAVEAA